MEGRPDLEEPSRILPSARTQRKNYSRRTIVLNLALEAGDLGLWDWNTNTDEVYYDERWRSMLGYSAEEIEPRLSAWERLVHPEDKERVLSAVEEHVKGLTRQFRSEQRLKDKSGEWRWVLVMGASN